jgi:hypothetical protein
MGPGPLLDHYHNGAESTFRKGENSFRLERPALNVTVHGGQSPASLLWARLTGRCPSCRRPYSKGQVVDFCAAQWPNFTPA